MNVNVVQLSVESKCTETKLHFVIGSAAVKLSSGVNWTPKKTLSSAFSENNNKCPPRLLVHVFLLNVSLLLKAFLF